MSKRVALRVSLFYPEQEAAQRGARDSHLSMCPFFCSGLPDGAHKASLCRCVRRKDAEVNDITSRPERAGSKKEDKRHRRKKRERIIYRTVKETIIVTEKDVDEKWIREVNDSMTQESSQARYERRYCYRLDTADDRDEWVASYRDDPFFNLGRESPEEERRRLYDAISQLTEEQKRLIDNVYFKGYSMREFAEIEGVTTAAITKRHKLILKKLKEIY